MFDPEDEGIYPPEGAMNSVDPGDFLPEDVYKLFQTAFPFVNKMPDDLGQDMTTALMQNATPDTDAPDPAGVAVLPDVYGLNGTWIIGEEEDGILLPVVMGFLGLLALFGNTLVMVSILAYRSMRTGPNLMLLNIAVSDVIFMLLCVPIAIANHAGSTPIGIYTLPGVGLCKFVHYAIFVTVYVSIYSLVVACVFRFFDERTSGQAKSRSKPFLSRGNAVLSSLVIWIAFVLSHLNFLIQKDGAAFQESFICVHTFVLPDVRKAQTLWVTFLTCAFLLPLLIICTLSAVVLRRQRSERALVSAIRRRGKKSHNQQMASHNNRVRKFNPNYVAGQHHGFPHSPTTPGQTMPADIIQSSSPFLPQSSSPTHGGYSSTLQYEQAQNELNERRASREITVVIMASMVTKAVCWLPLQVFVSVDIFGTSELTEAYRKAEILGVCLAFLGNCLAPALYRGLSLDFKMAFNRVFRKMGCTCVKAKTEEEAQSELNETILSIMSDSSNQINYNMA